MDDIQRSGDLEDFENPNERVRPTAADPLSSDFDLTSGSVLFDGNLNHPDFYRQGIEALDEKIYDRKEYAKGTESLINHADSQWHAYVLSIVDTTSVGNKLTCYQLLCQDTSQFQCVRLLPENQSANHISLLALAYQPKERSWGKNESRASKEKFPYHILVYVPPRI